MNATDFLITNNRDFNRGVCMWARDREWCAKPLVVENYRGNFHEPDGYAWGHLFGIHVPDGLPEHDAMWICHEHSFDFLELNSKGNTDTTIWQFDHNGIGTDVTWAQKYEVSVRLETNLSAAELSGRMKGYLMEVLENDTDINGWKYLKVVGI